MSDASAARARGSFALRAVLRFVFRRIVAIYFREVEVAGEVPGPEAGGRLFGANHVNGLVDPVLVLTQTPCEISPIAKSTLWRIPGLRWLLDAAEAVPIVRRRDDPTKTGQDNEAVFDRVAAHLAQGGNILIFPEGTSHNEPRLLSLRSGAGRMLARASESAGGLTFQAVALEFDARDVFRSRALVLFGPVRRVAEMASADLAQAITTTLREDLSKLLLEGATWNERRALLQVAEIFTTEGAEDPSLAGRNRLGRRIEDARRVLGGVEPAVVADLEARVLAYRAELERGGATDALVARFARFAELPPRASQEPEPAIEPERVARAALAVLTLPFALVGAALYWAPYQLPRAVTARLRGDPDVASTYKLGVGLVVFPLWAAVGVAVAFAMLPLALAVLAAAIVVTSPFAVLPWLDRWDQLATRRLLFAPAEERRERLARLAKVRAGLVADLVRARDEAEGAPSRAA